MDPLAQLEALVRRAQARGPAALDALELEELPRLYRLASSRLALLETSGARREELHRVRRLVARAHGVLYRDLDLRRDPGWLRASRFLLSSSPRAIRQEWRILLASLAVFYGLTLIAFLAVRSDLNMAFSLQDAAAVEMEIEQLEATASGEPFRGNFSFGLGQSPLFAGAIMANNITVSILFFGSALVPPVYLFVLASNALMVGTYTGVAHHWGQAWNISSILWCHGMIELQMIVLAGAAGLVLARGLFAPGPWSRRHALRRESALAWRLFAPVLPWLVVAGLIEGYVSPHAPTAIRAAIALLTLALLVLWVVGSGRGSATPPPLVEPRGE